MVPPRGMRATGTVRTDRDPVEGLPSPSNQRLLGEMLGAGSMSRRLVTVPPAAALVALVRPSESDRTRPREDTGASPLGHPPRGCATVVIRAVACCAYGQ